MANVSKALTKKIQTFMENNPDAKPAYVAKCLKIPVVRVYSVRAKMKKEVLINKFAEEQAEENLVEFYKRSMIGKRHPVKKSVWQRIVGWFK